VRFLLQEDADRLIAQAAAANVLQSDPDNVSQCALQEPHDTTTAMTTTIDEAGRTKAGGERTETGRCSRRAAPIDRGETRHLRTQTVVKLAYSEGVFSRQRDERCDRIVPHGISSRGVRRQLAHRGLGDVAPISATAFGRLRLVLNFTSAIRLAPD